MTLKESYEILGQSIVNLFEENIGSILEGSAGRINQQPGGTSHRTIERLKLWNLFPLGWDTPCEDVSATGQSRPKLIS